MERKTAATQAVTESDLGRWHKILVLLALNFSKDLTASHFELYDALLLDYSVEELDRAANIIRRDPDQRFMPNLNDFERVLQCGTETKVNVALERLNYAMSA